MAFGTGAVKVTPAHDAVDNAIGKRHTLPEINILTPDGKLNENVPEPYRGLTVIKARARSIEDTQGSGAVSVKEEDHVHQVGHCYRCSTVDRALPLRPVVRADAAARRKALKAWEDGEAPVLPAALGEHLRELAARTSATGASAASSGGDTGSPSWYCAQCGEMTCRARGSDRLPQMRLDRARAGPGRAGHLVLLGSVAVLHPGLAQNTADLRRFYPTTTLVTGYDIIFFWVARMIMMGLEFMGEVPFRDIYITASCATSRAARCPRASGNGIDPLEIIDQYGADALKFTLAFLCAQGQDVLFDKERREAGLAIRQQDLERLPLYPDESRGPHAPRSRRREAHRHRPLDPAPARERGIHGQDRPGELSFQRGGPGGLRVHLERLLRLVHRGGKAFPEAPTSPRRTGLSRSCFRHSRRRCASRTPSSP